MLAVIDYKSGKSDYESLHLQYNPQLLFYALAYSQITNTKVEVIGIHNLKSNNLVLSKINPEIQDRVLKHFFYQQKAIENNLFCKHLPESKYSPCLNSFGKVCSYFKTCYPEIANS